MSARSATRARWRFSYLASSSSRASRASSARRLADRGQVLGRRVDRAEMGDRETLGLPGFDDFDRFEPGLDIDVGRRGGGDDEVGRRDQHGGDVADEGRAGLLVEVADVVGGVAGGVGDAQAEHRLAAGEGPDVLLGDGDDLAPEHLHRVAVEPLGAGQEARRVDQVGGAELVDVDRGLGPAPHDRAGRRRVVEVDVGEDDRRRLLAVQGRQQSLERGLRAGVDQRAVDLPAADHVRAPQVLYVDDAHRGRPPLRPWPARGSGRPLRASGGCRPRCHGGRSRAPRPPSRWSPRR